ncbi:uncharacterized protein Tco025E_09109 [Trypanosoma conorhini]|uniref:Uncharacterized protein n=1 Tax=Trypanosoma conorhini TaxID=83891 RepID=A0A3R7N9X0_9TRYP|nr:uncharacterized protein Tco025E_09109 [Trypanosoma conorhini]RNE99302.1 hypothetical protein Tco025E_09109 [Trypanosoma conorhini]
MDGTHTAAGSPNVTVANVLLYGRVLGAGDLQRLQLGSCTIPPRGAERAVAAVVRGRLPGRTPKAALPATLSRRRLMLQPKSTTGDASVPSRPHPPPPQSADAGLASGGGRGDDTLRGRVSRAMLLTLLRLRGAAAVF